MLFHQRNFDFNSILKFVIFLLLVCPVHLYPRPDNEKYRYRQSAQLETLNSKIASVNVKNEIEKPEKNRLNIASEFKIIDATNEESENILADVPKRESSTEQGRQITIPFMAVPSNWLATFQPSNAVVFTQKIPLRIWAIGSVSRFPSFLEQFVQRIQSYYSTYKYQDLSRPASLAIINPTYHHHDISGPAQTDPIDHDTIEEDITDTITTEYYDNTNDSSYYDDFNVDDENNSTNSIGNTELSTI